MLSGCGGGSVPNQPAAISVSVSPSAATVMIGGSQQFAATVSNTPDQSVTWSVNGAPGGNPTTGTISSSGVYTSPASVPSTSITVAATSHADPSKTGNAALSLLYPAPIISNLSPSSESIGSPPAPLTVNGAGFTQNSQIQINNTVIPTKYVSSNQLSCTIPATLAINAGDLSVAVSNPTPGGGVSNTSRFSIVAGSLVISIAGLPTGTNASVTISGPNGFAATITADQTFQNLVLGTYTISASPVSTASATYHPSVRSQTVSVVNSSTVSTSVNYANIVPATTKVLDALGMQTLSLSADDATISISTSSNVAMQLQAGDVLVSAPAAAAPTGLAFKISSVTNSGGQVILTGSPATLAYVFKQATIHLEQTIDPTQISVPQSKASVSPITITALPRDRQKSSENGGVQVSSIPNSCDGKPAIQIEFPDSDPGITVDNSTEIKINGSLEFCPSFAIDYDYSFLHLNSASAILSIGQHASLQLSDTISTSITATRQLGPSFDAGTYTFRSE